MATPLLLLCSTVLWTSLTIASSLQDVLRLSPDQSQFLAGKQLLLRCKDQTASVLRNTSQDTRGRCDQESDWGILSKPYCKVKVLKTRDSGKYWCESAGGATSEPVTVTVRDRGVILQSPVHPVVGQTVNLTCRHHSDSASQARFYRDGHLLSGQTGNNMTLQKVAPSDEGQYTCVINGEQSAQSRLRLHGKEVKSTTAAPPLSSTASSPSPSAPASSWFLVLVPVVSSVGGLVVVLVLLLLVVLLVRRHSSTKPEGSRAKRRRERPPQAKRTKASSGKQKGTKVCPKCNNSVSTLQPLSP